MNIKNTVYIFVCLITLVKLVAMDEKEKPSRCWCFTRCCHKKREIVKIIGYQRSAELANNAETSKFTETSALKKSASKTGIIAIAPKQQQGDERYGQYPELDTVDLDG